VPFETCAAALATTVCAGRTPKRKISDCDGAIVPANDEPLCHVLQLADISRPFPPEEVAERVGREPRYRHAVLLAVSAKEVPEQLRFEQRFGDTPAIDRDECSRATLAARMNLARCHFPACTGVAGDEDLCVACRGDFDVGL